MIARWCISALIFSLTVFGVISQQQLAVPNQEIVLQFSDVELSSEDAKNTIAAVRDQLLELGVENIKVKAQQNGKLKISYYSVADISSIKRNFSKSNDVVLDYSVTNQDENSHKFPSQNGGVSYDIDVYEIQNHSDSEWGFDGAFVLDVEVKSDRFLDPNLYFPLSNLDLINTNNVVKLAYKVRRKITIEIGKATHSKPEVRAGPNC
jgi:hypothetical protein